MWLYSKSLIVAHISTHILLVDQSWSYMVINMRILFYTITMYYGLPSDSMKFINREILKFKLQVLIKKTKASSNSFQWEIKGVYPI
jgi:hypothetical protein